MRTIVRVPILAALLISLLSCVFAACETRLVGGRLDGPLVDRGKPPPPPRPDFGTPWPDFGKPRPDHGAPECTCAPWQGNNSCNCNTIYWGCKEKPKLFSACDVPPPCLLAVIDPVTGCRKPEVDMACKETCFPPPPPPPPGCVAALIGTRCSIGGSECAGPSMTCLVTDPALGGVCTCPCKPDDPATPLVNEDDCPSLLNNYICGQVKQGITGQVNLCFRKCEPKLGTNPCQAPLACDPRSAKLTGLRGQATCVLFGCQKNADCPVLTDKSCQAGSGAPPTCGASEYCHPISSGGKQGLCAKSGLCGKVSGLCAPRLQYFKATAKVADSCKSDLDCAANQRCERERNLATSAQPGGTGCTEGTECCSGTCSAGKCAAGLCPVHARNGYCVVEGCAFSSFKAYACPVGSTCNRLFPRGTCQRKCDLKVATSCRGNAQDKLGDYECRAWNNISAAGVQISDGPVCDFGDRVRCNTFKNLGCDAFGLQANPTNVSCRDLAGIKLVDPRSPLGLCLDDTASGP